MHNIKDLKSILLLSHLSDAMIDKIYHVTQLIDYKKGDIIFQEGEPAEYLFSILEGKVELEIVIETDNPVYLKGINQNFTFGISSLIMTDEKKYIQSAKAVTDSRIYKWKAMDLEELFSEDTELGYLFMRRIAKILKTRFTAKSALISDLYKYVRSFGKSF